MSRGCGSERGDRGDDNWQPRHPWLLRFAGNLYRWNAPGPIRQLPGSVGRRRYLDVVVEPRRPVCERRLFLGQRRAPTDPDVERSHYDAQAASVEEQVVEVRDVMGNASTRRVSLPEPSAMPSAVSPSYVGTRSIGLELSTYISRTQHRCRVASARTSAVLRHFQRSQIAFWLVSRMRRPVACSSDLRTSLPATHKRSLSPLGGRDRSDAAEERQLKHRATGDTRPVSAHPGLVSVLRRHIAHRGVGPDGRLFVARTGRAGARLVQPHNNPPSLNTIYRAWHRARRSALSTEEFQSPLARRPYDLRHACLSTWLNAGVPPVQVGAEPSMWRVQGFEPA